MIEIKKQTFERESLTNSSVQVLQGISCALLGNKFRVLTDFSRAEVYISLP